MKNVGLSAGDLSRSSLLIQGFNKEGQRTLNMISIKLHIGDMVAETPFQVIDSRTSYNLLLDRLWLHANGVVPSTLHQCFKYWENGEQKTMYADESLFTEAEASFADAKFYLTTRLTVKLSPWPNPVSNAKSTPTQVASPKQLTEVKYPSWIANIVPIKQKNNHIWVCVDFRDLNKACPKDDFPLPITELMVDVTTGHEALSFMDESSGYNHIQMDPKDEELTTFRTPKGIFCYKMMSFGLQNAGATYQRVMQNIFDDFLHKCVECYVDDLVEKMKERSDHLLDLRAVFERLRRFQLKMKPLKCAFGVTSGKFLGFVVHHQGIEIDQSKIDAIQKMPDLRNISELKSFQGHLAYIRRFISNLA
ncbi:hypothetical protein H6P81_016178 [Aristolochia fimbriata]|uniref:Reverse transcriptase domain-containing protein n=1 Tax=Aristolochia fimbriata TaxID=158543 RepID=A0AAV7E806_ARIFI|nr:hypothetical protein H6P81_016178 [Aristolochia fimbriata]